MHIAPGCTWVTVVCPSPDPENEFKLFRAHIFVEITRPSEFHYFSMSLTNFIMFSLVWHGDAHRSRMHRGNCGTTLDSVSMCIARSLKWVQTFSWTRIRQNHVSLWVSWIFDVTNDLCHFSIVSHDDAHRSRMHMGNCGMSIARSWKWVQTFSCTRIRRNHTSLWVSLIFDVTNKFLSCFP
jgi:hypothetical protein